MPPWDFFVAQKQQSREDRFYAWIPLPIGKAGELLRIGFPRQYQYVLRTNPYKKRLHIVIFYLVYNSVPWKITFSRIQRVEKPFVKLEVVLTYSANIFSIAE